MNEITSKDIVNANGIFTKARQKMHTIVLETVAIEAEFLSTIEDEEIKIEFLDRMKDDRDWYGAGEFRSFGHSDFNAADMKRFNFRDGNVNAYYELSRYRGSIFDMNETVPSEIYDLWGAARRRPLLIDRVVTPAQILYDTIVKEKNEERERAEAAHLEYRRSLYQELKKEFEG